MAVRRKQGKTKYPWYEMNVGQTKIVSVSSAGNNPYPDCHAIGNAAYYMKQAHGLQFSYRKLVDDVFEIRRVK